MKKIIIKSKLPEDEIIKSLRTLTDDLRSRKLLQKSDELIDGLDEKDDKTFEVSINAGLMNPSNYKLISSELKKLGEIISNDLKNFDDNGDPIPEEEVNEKIAEENKKIEEANKEKVVAEQAVTPALSMHDTKELLFNVENMDIKSLLFSDEELEKKAPETPENEKKVEENKDPEPKKEPETKEHDDKDPNPAKPADDKDPKPADPESKVEEKLEDKPAEPAKTPEVKEHDDLPKPETDKAPESTAEKVEELEKKAEAEEKNFDTLYFSAEELQDYQTLLFDIEDSKDYQTLLFDIEAEKKAEEEKKEDDPKPEDEKNPEEKEHDNKPENPEPPAKPAPEGPKPEKKSLKEVLDIYEKTKKPYTNDQVASDAGVTVEEVVKMKKELGLMDVEEKFKEVEKCPIDKKEALKSMADLLKKQDAGKNLDVVEKFFCDAMKKYFTDEEIEVAKKEAAQVAPAEVSMSKMELIKKLNDENNMKRLGTLAKITK